MLSQATYGWLVHFSTQYRVGMNTNKYVAYLVITPMNTLYLSVIAQNAGDIGCFFAKC